MLFLSDDGLPSGLKILMKKGTVAFLIVIVLIVSATGLAYEFQPPYAFSLQVYPNEIRGDAIAGQRVVFLVSISGNGSGPSDGVAISASAPESAVIVNPEELTQGMVGEVTVIPDVTSVGTNVTLSVRAESQGHVQTRSVNFSVVPLEDGRVYHARELREVFVQWLQVNEPQLGITNQTQWMGTIVSPQWLLVEHYLFSSNDWEMHVYWHVMIPPYDWARIDLRQRATQSVPSISFEISSVNGSATPLPIPPPDETSR